MLTKNPRVRCSKTTITTQKRLSAFSTCLLMLAIAGRYEHCSFGFGFVEQWCDFRNNSNTFMTPFAFQRENYLRRYECEINHGQLLRLTFHRGRASENISCLIFGQKRGEGQQVGIINIYFVAPLIGLLNARF